MFTEILVLVAHNAKGSAHFVTVEISVHFFMNVKFRSFWAEPVNLWGKQEHNSDRNSLNKCLNIKQDSRGWLK